MTLALTNNEIAGFTPEKIKLLKEMFCADLDNNEFELFVYVCQRTGLDPFTKQIYPVKRWNSKLGRNALTIQTGIDGYRQIADRTGNYAPGKETTYVYDKSGALLSATTFIKKRTSDGIWHEVSETAFYSEYVQTDKNGAPTQFWRKMGHTMLAKCCEAKTLRRAFPGIFEGVYTKEEMAQADNPEVIDVTPAKEPVKPIVKEIPLITPEQSIELTTLIAQCKQKDQDLIWKRIEANGIKGFDEMNTNFYKLVYTYVKKKVDESQNEKAVTNA